MLDIATIHNGEPELLTDGFAYECDDSEANKMIIKVDREKHFPVALIEKAYTIQVELGEASVEKDKTRILNAITGAEFDATPDLNHPAFGRVNKFLRSQIIANGQEQLVAAGQMGEMIDCVCADSGRTTLALKLSDQKELRDLAAVVAVGTLPALTS